MKSNLRISKGTKDFKSNFSNTTKLLDIYRPVKLQMELAQKEIETHFGDNFLLSTNKFLKNLNKSGINPNHDKELNSRIFILNQNQKMLEVVDNSLHLLKKSQKAGIEDFWILHYSYIYKDVLQAKEIVSMLEKNEIVISNEYFYQRRKRAIRNLEKYIFGFYSTEVIEIIDSFYHLSQE